MPGFHGAWDCEEIPGGELSNRAGEVPALPFGLVNLRNAIENCKHVSSVDEVRNLAGHHPVDADMDGEDAAERLGVCQCKE